jgi:hypothetical protein
MARVTISVPDDLQKRMRRLRSENWSAIAASAFETKLRELEMNLQKQKVLKAVKAHLAKADAKSVDVRQRRDEFIGRITFQADWRDQKTAEYPSDQRNASSARALRSLAQELDGIPPNDSLWVRYSRIWEYPGAELTPLSELESERLRYFGFDHGHDSPRPHADAVKFLRDHVEALEKLLIEESID